MSSKRFFWPLLLVELVILTAVISAAPNSFFTFTRSLQGGRPGVA